MSHIRKINIILLAVVGTLVLAGAGGDRKTDAATAKAAARASAGLAPLVLQVADGRVTGAFEGRPLSEILEALAGQTDFEYEGGKDLLAYPVSGRFDGEPVTDAMMDLLGPFNYMMTFKANGEIRRLIISDFRGDPGEATQAPAPVEPRNEGTDLSAIKLPPGMELTEEQLRLFEEPDKHAGVPPELYDLFYPEQAPGTEETGPPLPPGTVERELPPFTPYESETGPPGADISTMKLPEFTPYESEVGPVPDPFGDSPASSNYSP